MPSGPGSLPPAPPRWVADGDPPRGWRRAGRGNSGRLASSHRPRGRPRPPEVTPARRGAAADLPRGPRPAAVRARTVGGFRRLLGIRGHDAIPGRHGDAMPYTQDYLPQATVPLGTWQLSRACVRRGSCACALVSSCDGSAACASAPAGRRCGHAVPPSPAVWPARAQRRGAGLAVIMAVALTVVVVVFSGKHQVQPPLQRQWGTAAGRPHRVSAAATMGRIVNGRVLHAAAARRLPGPVVPPSAGLPKGTVPGAVKVRPLRLPARGRAMDKAHVSARPPRRPRPGSIPGPAVRCLPAARQTRSCTPTPTARGPPSYFSPRSTTGDPAAGGHRSTRCSSRPEARGRLGRPCPSPLTSSPAPLLATPAPTLYQTPAAPPAPVGTAVPSASTQPSSATAQPSPPVAGPAPAQGTARDGWTERSAAEPVSFAPFADAPALVTLPVGGLARRIVRHKRGSAHRGHGTGQHRHLRRCRATQRRQLFRGRRPGQGADRPAVGGRAGHVGVPAPAGRADRAGPGPGGAIEFTDAAGKVAGGHAARADDRLEDRPAVGHGSDVNRSQLRPDLRRRWARDPDEPGPGVAGLPVPGVSRDRRSERDLLQQRAARRTWSPRAARTTPGGTEIDVGTYDGGTNVAKAFMQFSSVSSALANDTVLGASLGLFNAWSYSCSPRTVDVYPVTSSWSVTGAASPTRVRPPAAAVGSKSFATGWVPEGSAHLGVPLAVGGNPPERGGHRCWSTGGRTARRANDGLALGASGPPTATGGRSSPRTTPRTESPFLAVTYTPYGAKYDLASAQGRWSRCGRPRTASWRSR